MKKTLLLLLITACFCGCVRSPTSSSIDTNPSGDIVTFSAEGITKSVQILNKISVTRRYYPSHFKRTQQPYWGQDDLRENSISLSLWAPVGGYDLAKEIEEIDGLQTITSNDYKGTSKDVVAAYTVADGCFFRRTVVYKFSENILLLKNSSKLLVKLGYGCSKYDNQWKFIKSYTDEQLKILNDFIEESDNSIKIVSQ